ncbi:MAG TPA: glycosyltransferase [Thermoanaerobaculia bacterium]|jgi:glycosyltransferase involved in cell wall biosynthesis
MVKLSVVMSIYNGASTLVATMDSILGQTMSEFELIAIDDGSTDETRAILERYAARDTRIRVIAQENSGLTRALIRGCAAATAALIARHDCGDRSEPERFAMQCALFDDPEVVLASCSTRYIAPGGELMYVSEANDAGVRKSLLHDDMRTLRGLTHHGSAMFRRDAYQRAGGYRAEFRVAQDLDLWIRLAKLGRIAVLPETLYEARIEVGAISAERRDEQVATAEIALRLRDEPLDDAQRATLLQSAASVARRRKQSRRRTEALTLYFIASCLRRARNPAWFSYARRVVRRDPLLLRGWVLLLRRPR